MGSKNIHIDLNKYERVWNQNKHWVRLLGQQRNSQIMSPTKYYV